MYHVFRCKPSGEGSWSLTRSFETDFMHHCIWCTVHQIPTRPKFYWTLDGSDQAVLAIDRFMITTPQSLTQSHSLGNSVDDFPSWIILAEKSSLNHNHSCTRFFQMQAIWWWSLDTVMQIPYLVIPIQIQTILDDKKTAKGLPKHNKIMNLRQCRTKVRCICGEPDLNPRWPWSTNPEKFPDSWKRGASSDNFAKYQKYLSDKRDQGSSTNCRLLSWSHCRYSHVVNTLFYWSWLNSLPCQALWTMISDLNNGTGLRYKSKSVKPRCKWTTSRRNLKIS